MPLTFDAALARGLVHYFGAELAASSLPEAMPFTVGDNQTYRGFWNPPLEPRKAYLIYFQATSHLKGVRDRPGLWWGPLGGRLGTPWSGPLWKRDLRPRPLIGTHPPVVPPLLSPAPSRGPPALLPCSLTPLLISVLL